MTSSCAWENRTHRHVKSSVKIYKTNKLEALRKHMGFIYETSSVDTYLS